MFDNETKLKHLLSNRCPNPLHKLHTFAFSTTIYKSNMSEIVWFAFFKVSSKITPTPGVGFIMFSVTRTNGHDRIAGSVIPRFNCHHKRNRSTMNLLIELASSTVKFVVGLVSIEVGTAT